MKKSGLIVSVLAVAFLLGQGAASGQVPPNEETQATYQGLLKAATNGDTASIRKLVTDGADLDQRDSHGRTPLMIAAHLRHPDAVRTLLAAGADINLLDKDRYDVITIAAVADDPEMVAIALEGGGNSTMVTSRYDGTALIAAAHLGHVEVVKTLIAGGAPLDHVNNLNWTALIEAIVLGDGGTRHTETVRALVTAGADVNLPDGNGVRPLTLARQRGYREITEILEAHGAESR